MSIYLNKCYKTLRNIYIPYELQINDKNHARTQLSNKTVHLEERDNIFK